jgi:hypothetical protein
MPLPVSADYQSGGAIKTNMPSTLDRFLPGYRHNEVHETVIAASPERVLQAVEELTVKEMPLTVILMGLRTLPARLLGRPVQARGAERPVLEVARRGGFLLLSREPREVVLGVVGQFWKLAADVVRLSSPEEFLAFSGEGYAKAAVNFSLHEEGGGRVRLRTETRILPLGKAAARRFGLYWFFVHPGSAVIRRAWLRAIRRRAERQS